LKKIIVINGSGGSGKDTLVEVIKDILNENIIVKNISSIDPIKEIAKKIGWNGKRNNEGRRLLSDLKDAMTRYNDLSFNYIRHEITVMDFCSLEYLIFIHIRECDEIKRIVDYYSNVTTLLIKRSNMEKFFNHADMNIENYNYDYVIKNDGNLDCLKNNAKKFIKEINYGDYLEEN